MSTAFKLVCGAKPTQRSRRLERSLYSFLFRLHKQPHAQRMTMNMKARTDRIVRMTIHSHSRFVRGAGVAGGTITVEEDKIIITIIIY